MKKALIIAGIIIVAVGIFLFKPVRTPQQSFTYEIGILQTASHPALDAVQEGFTQELSTLLDNKVGYTIQNAQGSIAQVHALAQQFSAGKKYTAFFAIATPAAQAMAGVEKERPVIIGAVTDPHALGLIHPTTNVCGVNDMINIKAEVRLLQQLVPHAHNVGLLYTSGETNSLAAAALMRKELMALGMNPIDCTINSEADIPMLVEGTCRIVDVILAPTDNTVASSISLIAKITRSYKKPLIVSDNLLVQHGALAAQGVDYKDTGRQAARIAAKLLTTTLKPAQLPIEQGDSSVIIINKTTLELLGLSVPETLGGNVVFVEDK